MKVLIVEDDSIVAFTLEAALAEAGHEVIGPAASASHGLLLARRNRPELALVNITLRDGSSGVQLARDLLSELDCPSLFVSGSSAEARKGRDAALGLLAKPCRHSAVLAAVDFVGRLLVGDEAPTPPPGLELFEDSASSSALRHDRGW